MVISELRSEGWLKRLAVATDRANNSGISGVTGDHVGDSANASAAVSPHITAHPWSDARNEEADPRPTVLEVEVGVH
jgi:hypothetical protein